MASNALKRTTGLTGLAVVNNPHHRLTVLYEKIQRVLVRMPQEAAYRRSTEAIVAERQAVLQAEKDPVMVEQKLGCGQCEELIVQAENELVLAKKMLQWKPWEPLVEQAPTSQWKWPI
ncbi:NADH dehydrogenase [ubiquinone] 1 alpha subcomplex subunit 5-like [Pollicipes pollicipes]|uniref:NADH dehydrogenase [ubiquinone] 1 alpha subcomplex subunit 5-like n=1 Tax=Pollicipes pollicipes TaxID=41117 RepID=UPI001885396B|nr:NADH dehydrogenase [ubiquinone] 1 alpha subcomplex subunit 5-like [Pollicipes pollicipes]XP_037077938.1 NADH dehydrogenase [ubiquinone] 1 alpha subcomplex subunit 5-like [Pollicipes pollicipes]XP_037077940.1 NADH dehydrogenase [ubiquinone] 1 alpha subcomplex subunit 5-like [Pollicipes pollicipes]